MCFVVGLFITIMCIFIGYMFINVLIDFYNYDIEKELRKYEKKEN